MSLDYPDDPGDKLGNKSTDTWAIGELGYTELRKILVQDARVLSAINRAVHLSPA